MPRSNLMNKQESRYVTHLCNLYGNGNCYLPDGVRENGPPWIVFPSQEDRDAYDDKNYKGLYWVVLNNDVGDWDKGPAQSLLCYNKDGRCHARWEDQT